MIVFQIVLMCIIAVINGTDIEDTTPFPVFWHIPKSGGSLVKYLLTHVYGTRREFQLIELGLREDFDYVCSNHMVKRNIIKIVSSASLQQSDCLYDKGGWGKSQRQIQMFTIMRHPIDRLYSLFNYLKISTWERTYDPRHVSETIDQFVETAERNWITYQLTGVGSKDMNDEVLQKAKEILRTRIYVGLTTNMAESMKRIEKYYGWTLTVEERELKESIINGTNNKASTSNNLRKSDHKLSPDDEHYKKLVEYNKYDLALYDYAVELFASGQPDIIGPQIWKSFTHTTEP